MTHRFAIFGDSHYACLKNAVDQNLVPMSDDLDLEFWGHAGRRFRMLEFRDGAIHPTDDYTAERFEKFSTKKRRHLPMADFDTVFFMGCRINLFDILGDLATFRAKGGVVSAGLERRVLSDYLLDFRVMEFAVEAAKTTPAKIVMKLVSHPTWLGEDGPRLLKYPSLRDTTAQDRDRQWKILQETARDHGVTLLRQPEDTIVEGLFTHADYGVETMSETGDAAHKNAAYGALALQSAFDAAGISAS